MSALQHPPSYVRALIHSVPEQERFGFGYQQCPVLPWGCCWAQMSLILWVQFMIS